jgi:hypothetical protein
MELTDAPFSLCIEGSVDPTGEGIRAVNTLDDINSGPTGTRNEDSDFDKKQDIIELEMSDFDDVEGVIYELE